MPAQKLSYKAFTLIELMVVITIIAILAAIGAVVYSSTQKTARMSNRINSLKALQTALETYKAANGSYPVETLGTDPGSWRSECTSWGGLSNSTVVPNILGYPAFIPTYMASFPKDPLTNTGSDLYCYLYRSNGYDYKVLHFGSTVEVSLSDAQKQLNFYDPLEPNHPNHSVCAPGFDNARRFAIYSSPNISPMCW